MARCRCRRSRRRCSTLRAEGRLDRVRHARPHQLHLRRPHVQHAPGDGGMPRHQARPDLPVGRGLVRLCALVAVPAPAHGDGRCRGASRSGCADPASVDAYEKQQKELGAKPSAREAAEDAADSRSAQGQAAGLPDQLDPQVDVGDPPGLDGARARTSTSRRSRASSTRRCSPMPRPAPTSS